MTIADKLALLEQTKEAQRVKLGLPKNLPFSQYVNFIRDPFTPADLFANGEQGVWFDPSDLSTMFQDVNGTNVTKDGDPVGLILDKSQGLEKVTLKTSIGNIGGWLSESEGVYKANKSNGSLGSLRLSTDIPLKIGKYYTVTFDATDYLSGYVKVFHPIDSGFSIVANSNGSYTFSGFARSTKFILLSVGADVTISNVVISEVKGNHATQETASARPIYRTDGNLHWLEFDGVDDTLSVQLPSGTYTEIKASRNGVMHKYPVNVNGSYTIGDLTQTKQSVSRLVLVNRQLTQAEIENVTNLMKVKAGLPL